MLGTFLSDLTWIDAEPLLRADPVVVIPIGAAAKEHGPHLRLDNDLRLADYHAGRIAAAARVVITSTLGHHFYPAFVDYPGSISLRLETARDLVVDVVRSLARHGARRFYALNTGVSTVRALEPARAELEAEGLLFRFTDVLEVLAPLERDVAEQAGGTHADEIETSMMLVIAPERVDMSLAVRDYRPKAPGPFRRQPDGQGTYSPTGTWGDPTLATRAKGEHVIEGFLRAVLAEIEALRLAPLP